MDKYRIVIIFCLILMVGFSIYSLPKRLSPEWVKVSSQGEEHTIMDMSQVSYITWHEGQGLTWAMKNSPLTFNDPEITKEDGLKIIQWFKQYLRQ